MPHLDLQPFTDGVVSNRDFLRSVFHSMLRGRILENKLSSLYKAGKIVGGVYLGRGQEAVSATLGTALIQGTDFFAPLIRDQAGRTAFGEPLIDCTRTYLGSAEGPMRGRDGNIHRGRPRNGNGAGARTRQDAHMARAVRDRRFAISAPDPHIGPAQAVIRMS